VGRQQGVTVGAHGIKGDIAEIQQTGQTNDDVQAPAEHDIGGDEDGDVERPAVDLGKKRGLRGERQKRKDDGDGKQNRTDEAGRALKPRGKLVHRSFTILDRLLRRAGVT
jgi:hypothetical protein